jgi:hypothetical protein
LSRQAAAARLFKESMNRWRALAILALLVAMTLMYSWSKKEGAPQKSDVAEVESKAPSPTPEKKSDTVATDNPEADVSSQTKILHDNFNKALSGLQTCFKYQSSLTTPEGDPSLENWKSALRPELGEVVLEAEDWTNTQIVLPNGEKRRIRIETEISEDNLVTKKLKYATVDAEDLPVPIPLPPEQSENPTETFIASLEKEGEVSLVERADRLYYSDGSEIMSVQRSNSVSEIEVNKAGVSFHCWNLDKTNGQCECL